MLAALHLTLERYRDSIRSHEVRDFEKMCHISRAPLSFACGCLSSVSQSSDLEGDGRAPLWHWSFLAR